MLEDKRTGVVRPSPPAPRSCAFSMPPVSSLKLANLCLLKDALTIEPANEGRRTSSKDGSRCKRYESNATKSSAQEAGMRFRDIVGKRVSFP